MSAVEESPYYIDPEQIDQRARAVDMAVPLGNLGLKGGGATPLVEVPRRTSRNTTHEFDAVDRMIARATTDAPVPLREQRQVRGPNGLHRRGDISYGPYPGDKELKRLMKEMQDG